MAAMYTTKLLCTW